ALLRARSCRGPGSDPIRLLGTLHIDNPKPGEKLFGFWENPIGDRLPVLSGTNHAGLMGKRQPLGGDEHAGVLEFLVKSVHESEMRLEILLRPLGVPLKISLRARHHENVLHLCPLSILHTGYRRLHDVVEADSGFSTSVSAFWMAADRR